MYWDGKVSLLEIELDHVVSQEDIVSQGCIPSILKCVWGMEVFRLCRFNIGQRSPPLLGLVKSKN